jgi:predicted transcriptional regulator
MKRRSRRSNSPRRRASGARKTLYELPPLELECMKVLWELEEASVRDIREQLAADSRPRAYTTVETIMDRLTRKGAVTRRKVGKAHRYTAVYRKVDARAQAITAVAEHFFAGSRQAMVAHLTGGAAPGVRRTLRALAPPRAGQAPRLTGRTANRERDGRPGRASERRAEPIPETSIDTSLL